MKPDKAGIYEIKLRLDDEDEQFTIQRLELNFQ